MTHLNPTNLLAARRLLEEFNDDQYGRDNSTTNPCRPVEITSRQDRQWGYFPSHVIALRMYDDLPTTLVVGDSEDTF